MIKALVLFGSESDKTVYQPLVKKFSNYFEVDFAVLSAHRNPDELTNKLTNTNANIIVAGAGLAAHLPGVIASKTNIPVFGIPVDAAFSGIDAMLSILQMPFGVPVVCSAINNYERILDFMKNSQNIVNHKVINLVIQNSDAATIKELERTKVFCVEKNLELQISDKSCPDLFNIHFVKNGENNDTQAIGLCVPILNSEELQNSQSALEMFKSINTSGLWVGVNNARNAVIFYKKLINKIFIGA